MERSIGFGIGTAARVIAAIVGLLWIGAMVAVPIAVAQPPDPELAACAAIEQESARLECYDRAIAARGADPVSPDRAESAPAGNGRTAGAEDSTGAAPLSRPPASTDGSGPEAPPVEPDAPAAPQQPEAAASSEAQDASADPESIETFPQSRAQRRAASRDTREDESETFSVVVVQYLENLSGLGVFVAETGEIYDQVSVRRSRFPDTPFVAELAPASRNSYWLRTERGGRPIRVVER